MKLKIATLLVCCAMPAKAQDLPVRLADGASWTITAEHSRRAEGMGQAQNWSLTTVKRLTWHAGGKGKPDTLTVTPLSSVAGADSAPEVATARSLGIPATLVVDKSLAPREVVNRDETRAEFRRLVPNAPQDQANLIDSAIKAMIASELAMASRGQGFGLKLKQPLSSEGSLPNPLGGPAVRAIETAELAGFDGKHGRALIEWRQSVDPESFKASTAAILTSMAKDKVDPAKIEKARAAFSTASLTNETTCLYEIDIQTGLARRGDCVTKSAVSMQGKTQIVSEHWTLSQTEPGKL